MKDDPDSLQFAQVQPDHYIMLVIRLGELHFKYRLERLKFFKKRSRWVRFYFLWSSPVDLSWIDRERLVATLLQTTAERTAERDQFKTQLEEEGRSHVSRDGILVWRSIFQFLHHFVAAALNAELRRESALRIESDARLKQLEQSLEVRMCFLTFLTSSPDFLSVNSKPTRHTWDGDIASTSLAKWGYAARQNSRGAGSRCPATHATSWACARARCTAEFFFWFWEGYFNAIQEKTSTELREQLDARIRELNETQQALSTAQLQGTHLQRYVFF